MELVMLANYFSREFPPIVTERALWLHSGILKKEKGGKRGHHDGGREGKRREDKKKKVIVCVHERVKRGRRGPHINSLPSLGYVCM